MVMMPQKMTTTPTAINIFLFDNLEVNIAENGAVTIPPISRPAITFQGCFSVVSVNKKVTALATLKMHFATVELPMTNLGVRPFLINVPVTNGPQPPPPKESINPPINPNTVILLFLFCLMIFFFLKAFCKIFIPR